MKNISWYIKHYLILLIGLLLMSLSIALAKIATLGTSPISSIPNVLSFLTPLTIGQSTMILMILIIILEFIILRDKFGSLNIIQLVLSLLFGLMIDFFGKWLTFIHLTNYLQQLILTFISILILAMGVLFEVNSRTIIMPGEGIAAALSLRYQKPFAVMKVRCDITMMLTATVLALLFLHGLVGVREGTVLSALITGRLEGFFEKITPNFINWLKK